MPPRLDPPADPRSQRGAQRNGGPGPGVSPPVAAPSGSLGARYHGITARHAAQPAATAVDSGASRRRTMLSTPSAATTRSASQVVRPSPTPGRSPPDSRTVRTPTPVRMSIRSPSPATSVSCRSSRCTTTEESGPSSSSPAATSGWTSHWPLGRRTPREGAGLAIASRPAPRPSAYRARTPLGQITRAAESPRSRSPRSSRVTCQPVRANAPATASPPTPAPTTTAERIATPYLSAASRATRLPLCRCAGRPGRGRRVRRVGATVLGGLRILVVRSDIIRRGATGSRYLSVTVLTSQDLLRLGRRDGPVLVLAGRYQPELRAAYPDEVEQRAEEDRDRHPVVQAHTEEVVRVVHPQRLDPEPADRVRHHVQRERPAPAEPVPAVQPPDQPGDADAPKRLVEERGVVRAGKLHRLAVDGVGLAVRHVVHLQAPRQVRRLAVQLVVEPVAPPADRLGERKPRGQRVGHERQRDADLPAGDPRAHPTAGHPAPDAQAAVPDLGPFPGAVAVAEVLLRRSDQAVYAGAEDTQRYRPDRDVQNQVRRSAASAHPALGHIACRHGAQHDRHGLGPDRDRSQVPGRPRRAVNRA